MLNETELSKKELILNVTLELIKNEGFDGVTVRKIASLADVNVGLINYYFGSKDKLINAVIQKLIASLKETFQILDDGNLPAKERLKSFLLKYLAVTEKYPFIVRVFVEPEPILFDSHLEYLSFVKAIGLKKVRDTIIELTGEVDQERQTIMLTQILGGVITPILIGPLYEKVTGDTFPDKEKRVDLLLERYFANKEHVHIEEMKE